MDATRIQIGLLEGKENWQTWKYKMCVLLRSVTKGMDIVNGAYTTPDPLTATATADEKKQHQEDTDKFIKTDSSVLILLTTNITEEILKMVMRFHTSREVWLELHRLLDGLSQDKTFELCIDFFSAKRKHEDDIATHTSKLKNIFSSLNIELAKEGSSELPEFLLTCKILETLNDEYFGFRSSWLLLSKSERSLENLTAQLCSHEKALSNKSNSVSEALAAVQIKHAKPVVNKNKLVCLYCKLTGHKIKQCRKWIRDGRPPKPDNAEATKGKPNLSLVAISSCVLSVENDSENWYVDNGATNHITFRRDVLNNFQPFATNHSVTTASGDAICAVGKGTVKVDVTVNSQTAQLELCDVWYVPEIKKNLFSVLCAQDKHTKSTFESDTEGCKLIINGETVLVGSRTRFGGLYRLAMNAVKPSAEVNMATSAQQLLQLHHERMGHQNKRHVKATIKRELGIDVPLDSELCEGCILGKAHRLKFGTRVRSTVPGERLHADVCGPFANSHRGFRYFVLFKDDYSKFRFVYFIKNKSEVCEKLKSVLAQAKASGHVVKELLSDNGGEFDNRQVKEILELHGIRQRLTMPYTPEQHGCVERENRTVVETARAMRHAHEKFSEGLWAELINTAVYVLNATGPTTVKDKSPIELWEGTKPTIKQLRIIGSECYVHIPKEKRHKMDPKATKGFLIGYEPDGYRIWIKQENRVVRSRDVIFKENPLQPSPNAVSEIEDQPQDVNDSTESSEDESESSQDSSDEDEMCTLRDRNLIKLPERFNDFVMSLETCDEPTSYQDAIVSNNSAKWKQAMDQEMTSLNENKTWTLQELPPGKRAIPSKWVYKVKHNQDGTIERFKARLVIKGFSQRKGIDYDQTFSPVARTSTVRTLVSVAANEKLKLTQFDVSTAFLYGYLKEEIYLQQPEGYEDGSGRVCRLNRSLYGLKQGPRCWNERFGTFMTNQGFKQSASDPCLFIKRRDNDKLIVTLYVDDGLIASSDNEMLSDFIRCLQKEFKITTSDATYYLGLEINRFKNGSIKLSQTTYTKRILERFGMSSCKPVSTPMAPQSSEAGKVEPPNEKYSYRQAVGSLMYLMTGTRPDIAYAVGVVSRSLENPTHEDWQRVKRIFRYLKGTENQGLWYQAGFKQGVLESYSDADHGGDVLTGRSTSGVLCKYSGGAVSWSSQRQPSVAISTTEAEIVAASEATKEMVWLKRLLEEIAVIKRPPELQVDNEAAIKLAQNPELHKRTKHIRIRHFFVREMVNAGEINVIKVTTELQLADSLTKPLAKPRHLFLCQEMGLK